MTIVSRQRQIRNYSVCSVLWRNGKTPLPAQLEFGPSKNANLTAAQERERHLEGGRYVDVVTGDPEKDHYSVGRMWLYGG